MRRIIKGVFDFLAGRKEIVINKEEIMRILPHRGRMLLLDEVIINEDRISGKFLVTEAVCEGHAVWGGKLVMRGSDLLDMAAQLFGVLLWQHLEFRGKTCVVWQYIEANFNKTILPGDNVVVETSVDIEMREIGPVAMAKSGQFVIKTNGGGKPKAIISSIVLAIFATPKDDDSQQDPPKVS